MTLFAPIWLLLAIPAGICWWLWRPPSRALSALRALLLLLVVLAMSRPALRLPRQGGTLVAVVDRSRSMPEGHTESQLEALQVVQDARRDPARLAVVSFAENAQVEKAAGEGRLSEFIHQYGGEASDLSAALDLALSLIPASDGRILLISDGKWTGTDPMTQAQRAAARGIPIDFRHLARPAASDISILRVEAPQTVLPGESYTMTAWVDSPTAQEVGVQLHGRGALIASGKQSLNAGLNRLVLRDRSMTPGTVEYRLQVAGSEPDPVPENNQARLLVTVQGQRPLLVLSESPGKGLSRLLAGSRLDVRSAAPNQVKWGLEELAGYSGLIIENVPAQKIGRTGMENLSAWVSQAGAGLMMTGGKNAFGPGGYFESPLDPILPVSMELRQEHRKLSLAIVVAMDRSGSMAVRVAGGMTKMDLANRGALEVLDLLTGMDEFSVIAVDSQAHLAVPLDSAEKNRSRRNVIASIASQGGGIFVYEALTAAAREMQKAQAGTKHILLFADAADSENPGDYQELLRHCREADISVSVVGLGKPSDQDAALLEDIARRGQGSIYFTDDPQELPRLFAQDTFVVARSTFLEELTPLIPSSGYFGLAGTSLGQLPAAGGYNLTYLRPGAELAVETEDEYEAPFTAFWQAGAGRALAYAGEVDGLFSGPLAGWDGLGAMLASLARWTAGEASNLPPSMLLTQGNLDGRVRIELHLDPERQSEPFASLPQATVLRGLPGQKPTVETATLKWESADLLSLEIPLTGSETLLSSVDIEGAGRHQLPATSLIYSPEYRPADADQGLPALQNLARLGAGRQRLDLASLWVDLPRRPRLVEISTWLLLMALAALLLEVLERRTRLLSARIRSKRTLQPAPKPAPRIPQPVPAKPIPQHLEAPPTPASAAVPPQPKSEEQPAMLDALRQARRRAHDRTKSRK